MRRLILFGLFTLFTSISALASQADTMYTDISGRISGHTFYRGNLWICTKALDVFEYDTADRKLEHRNTGLWSEGFGDGMFVHKNNLYLLHGRRVKKFETDGEYWRDISPDLSKLSQPRSEYMFSCLGGNDEYLLVGSFGDSEGTKNLSGGLIFASADGGESWAEVLPEINKTDLECMFYTGSGWIIGAGNSNLYFLYEDLERLGRVPITLSYKTWGGFQAVNAFRDTIFAVNDMEGVYFSTDSKSWHPYLKHRHTVALALGYENQLLGFSNGGGIKTFSPGKLGMLCMEFPTKRDEPLLFYANLKGIQIYGTTKRMAIIHCE
ncbi:MAG: hypothetical protein H6606_02180 [Flavobacteriales bacterium]|nr:hypothetical protein [Flavobacteriales bacterium]